MLKVVRQAMASSRGDCWTGRDIDVTEGQIGILVSAAAILAVAAALWRQRALGTMPLAVVVACVLGVSGFLVLSF